MIHHRPRRPEFDLAPLNFLPMTSQCPAQDTGDPFASCFCSAAVVAGRWKIDGQQNLFRINLFYWEDPVRGLWIVMQKYKEKKKKTVESGDNFCYLKQNRTDGFMKTNVVKWHRRCCQDAHPQKLSSSATAINNCRGCVDAVRTNDSTFWYNDKATAYSDWSRLSLFHVETGKYKQSPLIKARKYFRWFSFGDETKSLLGRRTTQPHHNKMKVVASTWQAWWMSLINYLQSIGDCFQDHSNSFF